MENLIKAQLNTDNLVILDCGNWNKRVWDDLADLRKKNILCDVTLTGSDGIHVPAHSCVLAAASSYFRKMFVHEMQEKHQPMTIDIHLVTSSALENMLTFIYDGQFMLLPDEMAELGSLADFLGIKELQQLCLIVQNYQGRAKVENDTLEENSSTLADVDKTEAKENSETNDNELMIAKDEAFTQETSTADEQQPADDIPTESSVKADEGSEPGIEETVDELQVDDASMEDSSQFMYVTLKDSPTNDPESAVTYTAEPEGVVTYTANPGLVTYAENPEGVITYTTNPEAVVAYTENSEGVITYAANPAGAVTYSGDPATVPTMSSIDGQTHRCDPCQKQFESYYMLQQHVLSVHSSVRPFKCKECGVAFKLWRALKVHEQRHGKPSFTCTVCMQEFYTRAELQSHKRSHTGDKPFPCSICHKTFSQRGNMLVHRAAVHKVMAGRKCTFQCSLCGKDFALQRDLERHLKAHARSHRCPQCGEAFKKLMTLKKHLRKVHFLDNVQEVVMHLPSVVKGEFECILCRTRFHTAANLKTHTQKVHQKLKRWACDYPDCDFQGYFQSQVLQHRKSHEKWQPDPVADEATDLPLMPPRLNFRSTPSYMCALCGKLYTSQTSLQTHEEICQKSIEEQISVDEVALASHKCTICKQQFSSFDDAKKHISSVHVRKIKKFQCHYPNCAFECSFRHELNSHRKSHTEWIPPDDKELITLPSNSESSGKEEYTCDTCDSVFASSHGLLIHKRKMHQQSKALVAQCPECKQVFKHAGMLRKHIACIHRRQKRFKCTLCLYKSYYLSEMKTHYARKHTKSEFPENDAEFLLFHNEVDTEVKTE